MAARLETTTAACKYGFCESREEFLESTKKKKLSLEVPSLLNYRYSIVPFFFF